ncbi:MAG TPA: helix-turn-helix transcriptional regulator [Vicinamibacteria bacterium]|nr:helix-turn-helix transcriptional regulator [Vicinamibacteria bacterium]
MRAEKGGSVRSEASAAAPGDGAAPDLVERLYAAVGSEPDLREVLATVARHLHSDFVAIHEYDHRRRQARAIPIHNFEQRWHRAYVDHFSRVNVWMINGRHTIRPGGLTLSHEMYPEGRLGQTEWYADFLRPQGLRHSMGAVLSTDQDFSTTMAFMRGPRPGHYGEPEVTFVRNISSHLRQALRLHRRLAEAQAQTAAVSHALDRFPMAVVLVDGRGGVVAMNRAGSELLGEGDGLSLAVDRLVANGREARALRALLTGAIETTLGRSAQGGGGLLVERPSGRRPLQVWVTPLPRDPHGFGVRGALAAVFVSEPERGHPLSPECLAGLHDLTAAESRLASLLAQGQDLKQAAETLALSLHTVRTQLRSVFLKTGTRRQAELVHLLLSGPAHLR